ALEQTRVKIEHVAGISFAARRAAQKQRHLAISDGLFRKIVIGNHGVHAVIAEVFAHRASRERCKVLHRRRIGGGRSNNDRVIERPALLEDLDELRDRRALLSDGDIDAIKLGAFICPRVQGLLVKESVENDRGFAGLTVADDELALATANWDE